MCDELEETVLSVCVFVIVCCSVFSRAGVDVKSVCVFVIVCCSVFSRAGVDVKSVCVFVIVCCSVFSRAGVDVKKPMVCHCVSGLASCTVVIAAMLCGSTDVAVYHVC